MFRLQNNEISKSFHDVCDIDITIQQTFANCENQKGNYFALFENYKSFCVMQLLSYTTTIIFHKLEIKHLSYEK